MTDFQTLLQGGNAWLFIPSAILLGALHGLEPGHSKTMMAAFIIAVRGTVVQAVLLGLAATISHTAIVWLIALGGMYFGQRWSAEASEPWMQIASAVLIVGVAAWMLWRTSQNKAACFHDHGSDGGHDHDHAHDNDHAHDHGHAHSHATVAAHDHGHAHAPALAMSGAQAATHVHGADCAHDHHDHDHRPPRSSRPRRPRRHGHAHAVATPSRALSPVDAAQSAHEREHAEQIHKRFAGRHVTTGQIVMFGLTGGLIPCPSSITVLLLCLQLKKIALGATLVLGFSLGLALTMVASGVDRRR